ncbi:LD-carboxypeptidase [Streptomyces sp. AV19]|uniref:S66 family peptidase n=1 Tax=Streptomyces sp. AV19 TaxID=2793068 RepID=UPI0018FE9D17|nr:S66 peptidase family protein [Streptomyces sp. AV19]MBH1938489.1 LD-carboxypeptidase [Streptomyces sp. AV19]MDG4535138.1 LD-carboxypeptidase [Streptomyces sp. AV19]
MTPPRYPAKPRPGDRVAVVSPSSGLPGLFPRPHELGLRRIREDFGLEPVEYPATRKMNATPEERAADLHAAFADPEIKAVIASIGGDDQLTVLPHLDRELLRDHPKPFFGHSDNTNLLLFLRNLGIVGYYGGSVMVHFGRPGALHPLTAASLRAALFASGPYELARAAASGDIDRPWDDPLTFASEPPMEPAAGWSWHRGDRVVEGPGWGGCLETLSGLLAADREVLPPKTYAGHVLFLETSEELPGADEVYRILRAMGERGLLRQFPALLMGRAKSWSFGEPLTAPERARFRERQRTAVLRALERYAPETMAVFDIDLGHTDPQVVIPVGGRIRVDGPGRRVTVTY